MPLRHHAFITLAVVSIGMAAGGCAKNDTSTTNATATAVPSASPLATDVIASPSAAPTASPAISAAASPGATFSDVHGLFAEKQITQLAALGVFGTPSGAFNASKPVLRRDFVRWLFLANNAIWANDSNKLIHPAQGSDSSFKDIQTSDPDFQYIEGMQDSGISVGFPDKTFRPDQSITREQALAIKAALDRGGVDKAYVVTKTDTISGYYNLPAWKDKQQISPEYVGAIATGVRNDRGAANETDRFVNNVDRTFGAVAELKPKQPLTRGEAAVMLSRIGPHDTSLAAARSASDALAPSPSVSASP